MDDSTPKVNFKRGEDFASLYANNVQFESSVWDLKLIFGQLDQANQCFEQHTAVTLPWLHAKIAAYFLVMNVLFHESQLGRLKMPTVVLPPRPDPNAPEVEASVKPVIEYLAWVHDQFFGDNPYEPPSVSATEQKPNDR